MKKIFLTLTLTLLFFSCDKKNALNNECIGDDYSKWTDCESSYTWKDGTFYNGKWKDGLASGYGKMEWYWGDTYVGEFLKGKPHGQGKMVWNTQREKSRSA